MNTVTPDFVRQGLIARGMAPHIADAFILNFKDESGLRPGINEIAPIVPGSRGGFGLAQWTGPRRVALESFAAERGVPVSDPNLQMDFLMTELQGPEARAAQSIFAAPDTGTAAAAIVRDFLRPLPQHQESRAARYTGQTFSYGPQTPAMPTSIMGYGPTATPAEQPKGLMAALSDKDVQAAIMGLVAPPQAPQIAPRQVQAYQPTRRDNLAPYIELMKKMGRRNG